MNKLIAMLLLFSSVSASAQNYVMEEVEDPYIQETIEAFGMQERGFFWDVEPFQDDILERVFSTDNEKFNELLMLSQSHVGLPYVWGGYSWETGVDCSNFTYKVFKDIGLSYKKYYTTWNMKSINENKYLKAVSKDDMKPGDMLVYGYKGLFDKKWHGHVVILIDEDYRSTNGKKGLTVGSHSKVGTQFISYNGFPNYFKYPFYKLVKVLRVKELNK